MSGDDSVTAGSGRAYLDSVSAVFEQNHTERLKRIQEQRVRGEVARAHSQYLQRNVVSPIEFRAARSTVAAWAKQHDVVGKAMKYDVKRLRQARHNLFSATTTSSRSPAGRGRYARSFLAQRATSMESTSSARQHLHNDSHVRMSPKNNVKTSTVSATEGCAAISRDCSQPTGSSSSVESMNLSCTNVSDVSDEDNDDTVYLSDEESDDGPFSCSVINCWAVFSQKEQLVHHLGHANHSPCNPTTTLIDGQLCCPPLFYMCPSCGHLSQKSLACQEHMVICDHLPLLSPLPVVAFSCPQCMAFFPDQVTCEDHMTSQNHQHTAVPFKGDCHDSAAPVPVPKLFAEELIARCSAELSTVRCIDCDTDISDVVKWQQHQQNLGQRHTLVAHSATTVESVVLQFLSDKTCDTCGQVLYLSPSSQGTHLCTDGMTGSVTDMSVETFAEFVRRCSVSSPQVSSTQA